MIKQKRTKFNVDQSKKGIKNRTSTDYLTGETIIFDSILEKKYYNEVVAHGLKDGSIKTCIRQYKYVLIPPFKYQGTTVREMAYVADFFITYADGREIATEIKGMPDAAAQLKKKLMYKFYPEVNYIWLSHTVATGWIDFDQLQKIRAKKKKESKNRKGIIIV